MNSVRVLVTGAGSGVGQGIIKSLQISDYPITIVSADISPLNSALYRTDEAVIIPKVEEDGALELIIELINNNDIHVVMIGSEFDLKFFSKNKLEIHERTNAKIIVSELQTIELADDKWLTAEFLRKNALPYSESFVSNNIDLVVEKASQFGFPVIVKSRTGTSSRDVYIVNSPEELIKKWTYIQSAMLQKIIEMPSSELSNEYTCSIFKTLQGEILGPFYAKRTLRGGTSWLIEVDNYPYITSLMQSIGNKMSFEGSLNIQLMMGKDGPIPFEINARFSGTTAVRAHFGFNEPLFALRSFYYGEDIGQPEIRKGVAMRYHEEVFIDDVSSDKLEPGFFKGLRREWF